MTKEPAADPRPAAPTWASRLAVVVSPRVVTRAPEAAVLGLVALSLAAGITVSLGAHRPWTTLPLALAIGAGLWRAVPPVAESARAAVVGARVVAGGVLAWIGIGFAFASQFLVVIRDPGFLALSGVWLTHHASTDIPSLGGVEAAATQANVIPDAWQAWNISGDVIQPQGAKMLPGVLSVGGWVAGIPGVLAANVVIGGVGMLAVYVLARRMMGPLAALGPAAVLGLSVSHLGLSRSPYSEPLTLVLIVASVAWAWRGLDERRVAPMIAAGAASGATALVRIDGGAYALGVLLGVAAVALARGGTSRRLALAFAVPQAAMLAAGYASLAVWSTAYLERLGDQARTLGAAYAAAVLALLLAFAVWRGRLASWAAAAFAPRADVTGRVAAGLTAAVVALAASRPLWMTDHRGDTSETDQFTNGVVASFQNAEHYAIDGTRTYAEHTVTWMSYYLTWPLIAAAAIGLAVLAWRAVGRDASGLTFLGAFAVPTVIYAVRPEIVPDQIWAIRRFEPITMPGLAIAAGVGLWWAARALRRSLPALDEAPRIIAAVLLVALPASTYISVRWSDKEHRVAPATYVGTRELDGASRVADDLCDLIDGRPVVLAGSSQYFGTIRVVCDVPVVLALVQPEQEPLAQMARIWGTQPIVLTQNPEWLTGTEPSPVLQATMTRGEYALQHITRLTTPMRVEFYAALVNPDGTLTAVAPAAG